MAFGLIFDICIGVPVFWLCFLLILVLINLFFSFWLYFWYLCWCVYYLSQFSTCIGANKLVFWLLAWFSIFLLMYQSFDSIFCLCSCQYPFFLAFDLIFNTFIGVSIFWLYYLLVLVCLFWPNCQFIVVYLLINSICYFW